MIHSVKKGNKALFGALVASVLVISGCGGTAESTDEGTTGGTAEDPVVIQYLHRLPDGEGMTLVQDSIDRFNDEHPGIRVEATKFDGQPDESYAKIHQSVVAGDGLCLAQVGYDSIGATFVAGDLMDVTDYADEYTGNYAEGPMAQMTVGGAVVGLPQDTGPLIYMYDTAAFDELGIEVPTTWDEFYEAAKTAREDGKYIGTFQTDEVKALMSGQAAAAGSTWFEGTEDGWEVSLDDEATAQVAEVYQKLIDEDLIKVVGRWDTSFTDALVGGEIIGTVGAGWEPAFFLGDFEQEETSWEVAHLPAFDPANPSTGPDGGSGVAVVKGCEHPEEAMLVANWYNTQVPDLVSQGLVVAATTEEPQTPENIKQLWNGQDVYSVLAEANDRMNPDFAFGPTWPSVGAVLNETGATVSKGGTSMEELFEAGQTAAVTSLEDAGLPVVE
ncbi:ABC transporter substrate-binding protein [Brachybacterium avium]|uniref:ABC transporter substrate-binding protein n=1 Tax=Brachybacterium avium TaxID=2017485 RepID=A0A220UEQ1_9MICO|nr:extracellular solute-binding protein [Brachybacterium avium]ASK66480.1 ABC transporter substrate-binding protein [Brachybacterium avium]